MSEKKHDSDSSRDIAVVGYSGRFPGSRNVEKYWDNLKAGVEGISQLTDEELKDAGVPEQVIEHPNYVKAGGFIEDPEYFDAEFFGINAREAEVMDPQHRVVLECAWEALENSGYGGEFDGPIGVFVGGSLNSYLSRNLATNPEVLSAAGGYQVLIGNDKDFLATRISYKLNLTGPSLTIQTACSTSLVAIQVACQSLLTFQSDMALSGGVSLFFPQGTGYFYQEGMILSPDGHCRTFDAKAQGTLGGQGVGIVVLKRLEDALAGGDTIHAVVKGSAINNDGSSKVGYTAPSVDGQAEVIAMAQALAGVDPRAISYVEAHGTATPLGDPIEIAALTEVFRVSTEEKQFCAIGSVKSNIGHLDTAAGVAGFIKAVLALEHKQIPPSLHFENSNPQIDFANSPFYVNSELSEWPRNNGPRRAGVSSFGIGGTNAHVVLEEAPEQAPGRSARPDSLLVWSAQTERALEDMTENLAKYLRENSEAPLADVAYTLQIGRKTLPYRRTLVARNHEDAIVALSSGDSSMLDSRVQELRGRPVVFMFSGQGSQYPGMGEELYRSEPVFRDCVDYCSQQLKPDLGQDLREILYAETESPHEESELDLSQDELNQTWLTQPALFVVEYALAKLWMSWGLTPHAMIGHSIGEYVAATLSGVMLLEDALKIVTARGRLMHDLPAGSMLAVPLTRDKLADYLEGNIDVAAINSPSLCAVSGTSERIDELQSLLRSDDIESRRLHTSHAFHSAMMDPILDEFESVIKNVALNKPQIPYISNVTGTWMSEEDSADPAYWSAHLRGTVNFAEGIREILSESGPILLEIGPGNALCTFARQTTGSARGLDVYPTLPHAKDQTSGSEFALGALGGLWAAGASIDWAEFHKQEELRRIPLPTYPFQRQRFFVEPKAPSASELVKADGRKRENVAEWLYAPSWKRSTPVFFSVGEQLRWLIFLDDLGFGERVAKRLLDEGQDVVTATIGSTFQRASQDSYIINPLKRDHYDQIFSDLAESDRIPHRVVSFNNLITDLRRCSVNGESSPEAEFPYFYSLLYLGQSLAAQESTQAIVMSVISSQTQLVIGDEKIAPVVAMSLALCRVIPQEFPNLACRSVDIVLPEPAAAESMDIEAKLVAEISQSHIEPIVAYRGNARWTQIYEELSITSEPHSSRDLFVEGGTYIITGGLGSVGMLFASYLAENYKAKLVLVSRSEMPAPDLWDQWLDDHDDNDAASSKIDRIRGMKGAGAEVLVIAADVSDREQTQRVLNETSEEFGHVNGLIHAAGAVEGAFLSDMSAEYVCGQLEGKVRGLQWIEELIDDEDLDFCMLVSSLSSVLGGLGFSVYSAANLFLDATAQKHDRSDVTKWVSVNWDGWDFSQVSAESRPGAGAIASAMTPQESLEALDILQSVNGLSQIVVSTGDLNLKLAQWVAQDSTDRPGRQSDEMVLVEHARPELKSDYVPPENDVQEAVCEIWQQLLGLEKVGIHDSFFELGGHSLLGTQVLSRLQQRFELKLPLRAVFEAPTVAELAERIQVTLWQTEESSQPGRAEDGDDDTEELEF